MRHFFLPSDRVSRHRYTTNLRHFACVPSSQSKSRFCDRKFDFLSHWRPNQSEIGNQSVVRCSFRPARKSNQSGLSKSKTRLAKRNATFIRIRIMSSNYYYFEWGKVIIFLIINALINSKLQHPPYPRANPGYLKFWRFDRPIPPPPLGQDGVQIPYPIVGYVCQMPFLKNNRCQLLSSLMQLLYNHAKFPLAVPLLNGKKPVTC